MLASLIVDFAIQYIPKIIKAVHVLKKVSEVVPDAIGTVKDLTESVHVITDILKRKDLLSPAERAKVDEWLAEEENADYWQQEKP